MIYSIKREKTPPATWGVFSVTYQGIKSDISRILSSLLKEVKNMYIHKK
jgi:hypothetical protein